MGPHFELLIDGHFYGGPCDTSIGKGQSYSPYNGSLVGTFAEGGWPELDAALDAATSAFLVWSRSSRRTRQNLLRKIATTIRERHDELSDLLCKEVGKPIKAAQGEITRTALTFDLAADYLTRPAGELLPTDYDERGSGYRCHVERFPVGPVMAIVPYNWPFNLAAHKIAPALAAGNSVIVKASTRSALCTLALVRLIHECGCPRGVINSFVGSNRDAERAVTDDRVKKLSFTGSVPVGWDLKSKTPAKKVTLELGGDASAIITENSDLEWATSQVVAGAFLYAGQICIKVQHVLIHESLYDRALDMLIRETESCPTGDPADPNVICGPVIDEESADRIMAWIEEAESHGSEVLAGGHRSGNLIYPTLIERPSRMSKLASQEVFGPVLSVTKYSDDAEAVSIVNKSRFGIQCGVFTENIPQAEYFYRRLEVGGVVINDYPTLRFDNMPYGGVKESGFGREGIESAYLEMTEPKVMLTRVILPPPPDERKVSLRGSAAPFKTSPEQEQAPREANTEDTPGGSSDPG